MGPAAEEEDRCFFCDHDDNDTACLKDARHTAALQRRHSGAPSWAEIDLQTDAGGWRHFLYGEPIHCGSGLDLQAREYKCDDYGEYSLRTSKAVRVRYEVEWLRERPAEGPPWRAVLYHSTGGHTFKAPLEAWMRFRWPEGR
jgi:hypothetical protein